MKNAIKLAGIITLMTLIVFSMAGCDPNFGYEDCTLCNGTGKCSYCNGTGRPLQPTIERDADTYKPIIIDYCSLCSWYGPTNVPIDTSSLSGYSDYAEAKESYSSYKKGDGKCSKCGGTGRGKQKKKDKNPFD